MNKRTFCALLFAMLASAALSAACPASLYVQEHLVGHWDAIENVSAGAPHDPSVTIWKDISGKGGNWSLASGKYEWRDGNAFYCKGTAYAGKMSSAQKNVKTAEICFQAAKGVGSSSYQTIWAGGQGKGGSNGASAYFMILIGSPDSKFTMCGKTGFDSGVIGLGTNYTVSAVYQVNASGVAQAPTKGYRNGEKVEMVTGLGYNDAGMDSCTIGGRGNNSDRNFGGKIYAIRLYDDELTDAQIKTNSVLDRIRFFNDESALGYSVADVPAQAATGYEICPEPEVKDLSGKVLEKGVDYALSYANNLLVGTATVTVTPIGAFAQTLEIAIPFEKKFEIVSVYCPGTENYSFNGSIGFWDAIENVGRGAAHDSKAGTWVDLNGGAGWTIDMSHGSWLDNALFCDGNAVVGLISSTSQYGVVTAEIGFRWEGGSANTGNTIWMSGQRTGGYSAMFLPWSSYNQLTFVRDKVIDISKNSDMVAAAVYNLESGIYSKSTRAAYLDGEAVAVKAMGQGAYNDGGGLVCSIGGRSGNNRNFKGRIYTIRLYSRELGADEIRHHAAMDRARYFGGPVLAFGDIPTQTYDGSHPCEPKLAVTNLMTEAEMIEGEDYRVIYRDNTASGTATALVLGVGQYAGIAQEKEFLVISSEFKAPGKLADTCTVEYSPASADLPVFSGSVKTFGDGEVHTVRLLMGTNPDEMSEAASVEVTAEGPFSVAAAWCDYGLPVFYRFVYETSDGEKSYYSDTSNSSEPSPDYKATYTWKGGAEADWAGSDSWTVSGATVSNPKPYPFSETLHAVIFPSKANATVRLKGGEACLYIKPDAGATFRLQGEGDEPVPFTTGIIRWYSAQNVTCVCDRVAVRLTNVSGSTDNSCERFGTGSLLRFENGGSISVSGVGSYGVNFGPNTGYTVEVDGGAYDYRPSSAANFSMSFSGQSRVLVRDGLVRANTKVSLCNAATGPSTWTFEGMAPRLVALADFGVNNAAGTTLTFKPGATGFAAPVISVSNQVAFAAGSYDKGPVTVSVPKDAGIWKTSARQDVVLLSAPQGINTNVIEFAQMPRSSGTFVYLPEGAENPTSLVLRYRPRGLALILR